MTQTERFQREADEITQRTGRYNGGHRLNEIQIFSNPEFGEVRTITINNEPRFVGKDVAEALGYSNASKAVMTHVVEEDKRFEMLPTSDSQNGNLVKTALINESGLYSLVLSSKLPSAKKFKHWITSEVLPSIRKHGGYIAGQEEMSGEELMAKALLFADRKIKEQNQQIEEMKPKVLFADSVTVSDSTILIGELAKILRQNGIDTGEKRLFEWLRDNGYLIKRKGTDYNMPTQRSMELGLLKIKETVVNHSSGYTTVNKTPKVTGKGQQFFINKFLTGVRDDAPTRINECQRTLQDMAGIDFTEARESEKHLLDLREELSARLIALGQDTELEKKRLEFAERIFSSIPAGKRCTAGISPIWLSMTSR